MSDRPQDAGPPPHELPAATGRGRELVGRRQRVRAADTGRRHHLGATPAHMPVLDADGTSRTTRANAVQLASYTTQELTQLAQTLTGEIAAAAGAKNYERAAALRDETIAVRDELSSRAPHTPTGS